MLLGCLGGLLAIVPCSSFAQALAVEGQPGQARYRGMANMKGLSLMEQHRGWTNALQSKFKVAPRPLPKYKDQREGDFLSPLTSGGKLGGAGGGVTANATGGVPSPPPSVSFQALPDNQTTIPPDTHGAVGPDHVLTVLNSQVRVQTRSGQVLSTVSLPFFWLSLGVLDVFDPKALYDHMSDRFMFTAMANSSSANSSVLIGVSQTGDPTGNWFLYEIDADPNDVTWVDYPSMGFNKDWIVVSANMFTIGFNFFTQANVWVFDKGDLYAGGAGNFTLFQETTGGSFTMVPAITHDDALDRLYLVETDWTGFGSTTTGLRVSEISGPVGNEVINFASSIVSTNSPWWTIDPNFIGSLPQLGSPFGIDGGDTRMHNVVYRNGSLWCTHTAFLPAFSPTHSAIQWWQFLPDGTLQQFGRVEDPSGLYSYAYPSIAVNARNDVLIGASRFSTNTYASASYVFRAFDDPPNTMREPFVFKEGEGPYFKTYFGLANRWGDYSSTVVDPLNDLDMWTIQEYAAPPVLGDPFGFQGRWGTWWALVSSRDRFEFSSANYTVSEEPPPGFATVTVLNVGGMPGSVDYATSDGTAVSGVDYLPASGTLTFAAGQPSRAFSIPIFDNPDPNQDKTINLSLFNPTGGNILGVISNAVVTIVDDETADIVSTAGEFNFSSFLNRGIFYEATENESLPDLFCGDEQRPGWVELERSTRGVRVTVVRTNGSTGRVLVDYSTPEGGTAIPFVHYIPVSGTLVFDDYQMSTNFIVPVLNNFLLSTNLFGANFINLALSNPRPAPEEEQERPGLIRPTLGLGATSGIFVFPVNSGIAGEPAFSWERLNWRVDEYDGRNPLIPDGSKVIDLTVILEPPGADGSVRVTFPNHVSGFILQAGSDYAASPNTAAGRFEVLPNPTFTDPSLSTITNYWDYVEDSVVLDFGNGNPDCRRRVSLVITNNTDVEFNEDVICLLIQLPNNPPVNPFASIANVTILHDDQPAGALDREWNPDNNPHTTPAFNQTPGANNVVSAVDVQFDGKSIIGGDFTSVNSRPRNRVARFNVDGSLDTTFVVGNGADDFVSSIIAIPTNAPLNGGKILIAGGFTSYNGFARNSVARLLPDGSLDFDFAPGNGADGPVYAMALQADGRVIVTGGFQNYNDVPRNGLARLLPNGTLDPSFDPGAGPLGNGFSLALVPDPSGAERILVGGDFIMFDNVFRRGVVQLLPDGSVDPSFDPGGGVAGGPVFAMGVQNDGAILLAGGFNEYDSRRRIRLARVLADGSLDTGFDPGNGPNDFIYTLAIQSTGKAVIGGHFTEYNGTRRLGLARVRMDGALDTSFMDTAYNQFAGLVNPFSFEPPNFVNSIAVQPDGHLMIGGSFRTVGGNPSYTTHVREVNFYVPEDNSVVFTRADKRVRLNVARILGDITPGPGNVSFEEDTYYVDENSDVASVQLSRTDGRLGTLVGEALPLDRTAESGLDFTSTNLVGIWPELFYQTNINRTFPILFPTNFAPTSVGSVEPIFLHVPILDDTLREGDEVLDLSFIRPDGEITLGGEFIPLGGALGRSSSSLVIADDDFDAGIFNFASSQYFTNENAAFAIINVVRTNGTVGRVSVDYMTTTNVVPPRATPGSGNDYAAVSGTIFFQSGQSNSAFVVPIFDDTAVEFDENVALILTNATGGAKLPGLLPTSIVTSRLTILDNDFPPGRLTLAATDFTAGEDDGFATVTVTRGGGNVGAISIEYETMDGTAEAGVDYVAAAGTLQWNDGESVPKSFQIPLVRDGLVEGPETIAVRLFDGRVGGVLNANLLGLRTNAVVTIEDGDAFGEVKFSQPFYQADEVAGTAFITVVRRSGMAGTGSVNFSATADSAVDGQDFVGTSGVLVFPPGIIGRTFSVPILDDAISDGNKTVTLTLFNPTNLVLGLPNPVTLTLIDDESFNEPAGSVDVTFSKDTQANGAVFAMDLQRTNGLPDGRIIVAGEFTDFNQVVRNRLARLNPDGTLDLTFDPGPGANGQVRAIAAQPDGKLLLGGFFTQVISTNRNGLARLNSDGTVDRFFNPGAGADNPVYDILLQPDDRILAAGSFSTFNNISRPGIVRLNTNGTVDASFSTGTGPNNTVFAVALQSDGKILIGGDFTAVDNVPRNRLARLNTDGSLDLSFDPGAGLNATVRSLLVQLDGRILAGGSFTSAGGETRNRLARFETTGALDTSFLDGGEGANNVVLDMALQVDGRLVVVGDFTRFNGVTRNRITRLRDDGSTDPTINFGAGTDRFIAATLIQPDRKILIGGDFTTYNDEPRLRIARLHGGATAGAGQLEFTQPDFFVQENGTNAVISVRRLGGTVGVVEVDYRTVNGTALAGTDYVATMGTLTFPEGETRRTFLVPIHNDSVVNGDRSLGLELVPGTVTGGAVRGPQPTATLTIQDDEGAVGFVASNFSVSEGSPSGLIAIQVQRFGGTSNTVSVEFVTRTNGTATAFVDFVPTNGLFTFGPGERLKTFHVRILDDLLIEGNETVVMSLTNVTGSNVLSIANSTLLLLDNDFGPGVIQFTTNKFQTTEGSTAALTVVRTNGSTGIVSVQYNTQDGTADSVTDYFSVSSVLAFADGETVKTILVPTRNDTFFELREEFAVTLSNPTGGATLGSPVSTFVDVFDDDTNSIVAAGSELLAESFTPANNAIDPDETVTLNLFLRNIGTMDTVDTTAYLQPGNGVTMPSAPQNYGALVAGGSAVGRTFSFRAAGNAGDQLVANLLLTEMGVTNSQVSFRFTLGGNASRSFANTNAITINDVAIANPYPSSITVANLGGIVTNITVTLSNLTHPYPGDLDILLVGPNGDDVSLMSDAGAGLAVNNVTLRFNDLSSDIPPEFGQIVSGTYRPVNYAGFGTADSFPFPAPPMPYTNINLGVFQGGGANGLWSLYIVDDDIGQAGSVANGWSLTFQTSDPVAIATDLALSAFAAPAPVALGGGLTCVISVTNHGPATASQVVVQDEMPASFSFVSASSTAGSWTKNGDTLVFNVGSLPAGSGASLTIEARTTETGMVTNTLSVAGREMDLIQGNNALTMVTTVLAQGELQVLEENGYLLISWPLEGQYALQSTEDLTLPNWIDVPVAPTMIDGQNRVIIPIGTGNRFYRLRSL